MNACVVQFVETLQPRPPYSSRSPLVPFPFFHTYLYSTFLPHPPSTPLPTHTYTHTLLPPSPPALTPVVCVVGVPMALQGPNMVGGKEYSRGLPCTVAYRGYL